MVAHRGRGWVLAPTLIAMEAEADRLAPGRSRRSDGSIGDTAHSSRVSDHNPDGGVVDAIDLTHDPAGGFDAHMHARVVAFRGDRRIKYIISNGQIWNPSKGDRPGVWRKYSGSNAHKQHAHFSVRNEYRNDTGPWFSKATHPQPQPTPQPVPPPVAQPSSGVPDMFLAIDGFGLFAVVDGVPIGFADLATFGKAINASKGVPLLNLPREQGEKLIQELLKKHAKAVA